MEILSWIGVLLILGAYGVKALSSITPKPFFAINAAGALFIIPEQLHNEIYSMVVFNALWVFIGIYGIARYKDSEDGSEAAAGA